MVKNGLIDLNKKCPIRYQHSLIPYIEYEWNYKRYHPGMNLIGLTNSYKINAKSYDDQLEYYEIEGEEYLYKHYFNLYLKLIPTSQYDLSNNQQLNIKMISQIYNQQFNYKYKMQQDGVGKTIDKYRIKQVLQVRDNGVGLLRAINITNNQQVIIKKAAIDKDSDKIVSLSKLPQLNEPSSPSGLLYNEVNIIKDMNIPKVLRCLQMIKTKRSLYLVYENYPQFTLLRFIKERLPAPALKLRFAKMICQTLQQIHRKGYIYISLLPTSIYVISGSSLNPNQYQLRFVGFQYAKKISQSQNTTQIDIEMLLPSQYMAPEITNQSYACLQSDIYSAGKIFQLLGLTQIKGKTDNKMANQTIKQMLAMSPHDRSALNKVWQSLKIKQNQTRLFDHPVLQLQTGNRKRLEATSGEKQKTSTTPQGKNVIQRRNMEEQERRLKKIIKIRTLVLYLNDLANFVLSQKSKTLFFLLLKKSIIVRANLIHQIKKMLTLYSGQHYNRLNIIKQILTDQQNQTLNLLSKVEQSLRSQHHTGIIGELQNRNQLNQQLMEDQIYDFVNKKRKEIKPFHSILDQKQRNKLIYLCSLSQKLVYGSFQKFFDEVVEDTETQLTKQKYFGYLKSAATKQIIDRLQKVLKQKSRHK